MAEITFKGNKVQTAGPLPAIGQAAPDFTLTKGDLSDVSLSSLKGKNVVLNVFPSIDTPTCAQSVRTFNQSASERDDAVVLCVSQDLPFAQSRFCSAERIEGVVPLSELRSRAFGEDYGVGTEEEGGGPSQDELPKRVHGGFRARHGSEAGRLTECNRGTGA